MQAAAGRFHNRAARIAVTGPDRDRDYYAVLGVRRSVGRRDLRLAYCRLALQFHPDRNPGDRTAEEKFRAVAAAYDVLADENKRAAYDAYGTLTVSTVFRSPSHLAEIELRTSGSLFDTGAMGLVNAVNCYGVMGAGIAAEFKRRYPEMFKAYAMACRARTIRPGTVWTWSERGRFIINFPTKDHWRDRSKQEWIAAGLDSMIKDVIRHSIETIAIPALGCGLGGLEFRLVQPLIEEKLRELNIKVYLFAPGR